MYRIPTIHPDLPAFSLSSAPLLLITPLKVSLQRDLRPESLGSPSSPRHNSLAFFPSQNLHSIRSSHLGVQLPESCGLPFIIISPAPSEVELSTTFPFPV